MSNIFGKSSVLFINFLKKSLQLISYYLNIPQLEAFVGVEITSKVLYYLKITTYLHSIFKVL